MWLLAATTCGARLSCEEFRAGNLGVGRTYACLHARDQRSSSISKYSSELLKRGANGFEPLTFCMPYKSLLFRNVAGCGSTRSFNRCTLPAVA
jgi:hypothetical protein